MPKTAWSVRRTDAWDHMMAVNTWRMRMRTASSKALVGALQLAVGDGEHDGVDGLAGAWGALIEDIEMEYPKDGGEGDAGGGSGDLVTLDDI